MKTSTISLFVIMVAAQIFVPSKVIFNQENILKNGTAYRFKLAPVDPNDPFRGKYIMLNFEEDEFRLVDANDWSYNESVFVEIENDENNFMKIKNVSREKPNGAVDFVSAKTGYSWEKEQKTLQVNYPFNIFYMEESKAPITEIKFQEIRRDSNTIAWALVKVLDGVAVVEDVLINGESVKNIFEK